MLNLVVLRSTNPLTSVAFYTALGCVFVQHRHANGPIHWADETGSTVFEIYAASTKSPVTTGLRLGFLVNAVEESLALALKAGGQVVSPPQLSPWGWRAVLTDPDGNRVELSRHQAMTRRNLPEDTESVHCGQQQSVYYVRAGNAAPPSGCGADFRLW